MIDLGAAVLTNAAGMVKTHEQAKKLLNSAVTRITIGSVKLHPWPGNSGKTYYYHPSRKTAWNSKGLDSPGGDALLLWLPWFHEDCKAAGKELAVSIAGSTPEEYGELAEHLAPHCELIEVNAGCGNVWGPKGQKPIPSYDPQLLHRILQCVGHAVRNKPMVTVKLSPVENEYIDELALVIGAYKVVIEAICCNTKILQEGKRTDGSPALAFREPGGKKLKHVGGMSGMELKPDSMRVLGQFIDKVPHLRYIGCGGIGTGLDFLDFLEVGAAGGAVGTAFFESDVSIFQDMLSEAVDILDAT